MANFKIDHFVFGANTLIEGSNIIKKILNEDLSEINVHETMGTHKSHFFRLLLFRSNCFRS